MDKVHFSIPSEKVASFYINMIVEVRTTLNTIIQFQIDEIVARTGVSLDEANKEVLARYKTIRAEIATQMIAEWGDPEITLPPLPGS